MSSKKKKKSEGAAKKRSERRFVPKSTHNPWLVRGVGGLGAMLLGAGAWGFFYGSALEANERLKPVPLYLIAAGFVLIGIALWLGTSSDAPVRVGDPGVGVDRGEVRRMPWWAIERIGFESRAMALVLDGKDENGKPWTFHVPVNAQPDAAGLLLQEAEARVPAVLDVPEEVRERIPAPNPLAGMLVKLEPLQVVGKRDSVSGKTINYEPDARVCERCERIYAKRTLPKVCSCGAALGGTAKGDDEDAAEEAESERASS